MPDIFCHTCGHRNPGNANFCSSCGVHLEGAGAQDEHTAMLTPVDPDTDDELSVGVDDLPEGTATLVVTRGPGAGSRFVLDRTVVRAGRHPDSDIFLDDVTVSRRHAELVRPGVGATWIVRDVGSLNGTYVNRQRIEDEANLGNGDEVQIGRFKLVFLTGGQ